MARRARRSDYGYAGGRVHALETRLIDRARFQRMVDAPTAAEAFRVLAETDYAGSIAEVKDVSQFEAVLARELDRVYDLLAELAPDEFLKLVFAYKFDIHNLKVLLKARSLGQDYSYLLVSRGTVPPLELAEAVQAGEGLPPHFAAAVSAAADAFAATEDPQLIDTILDGALYELLAKEARRRRYRMIIEWVQASIDLANIRTFLRVRRLGKDSSFLAQALLNGGLIPPARFQELFAQPVEALAAGLADTPYSRIAAEGARLAKDMAPLAGLEKLADDYLTGIAKGARFIPLGPESLFAYILAKENEIRNVRIILAGKLNDVAAETIRERLRDVDV
ncbi:MAG: V-type ATP synthase subunit C [Chloroflexota bacterium]